MEIHDQGRPSEAQESLSQAGSLANYQFLGGWDTSNHTAQRVYGFSSVEFEPEEGSRTVDGVEVRLVQGEIVRGTVVWDESGDPVPEVMVSAEASRFLGMNPSTYTDGDGKFALTIRKNVTYTIRSVSSDGFGEIRLADGDDQGRDNLEIRLKRGGTIKGTVVNEDGDPVPAAVVMWSRRAGPAGNPQHRHTTRQDGSFEMYGVGPGTIYLMADAPENSEYAVPERKTIDIASGEEKRDIKIVLPFGESVEGLVVDEQGEPVGDATVRWFISSGNQVNRFSNTRTDDEGNFTIPGVTPQTVITQIDASHTDYVSAYVQRYSPLDGELKMVLRRRGTQQLQAVDAGSGRPITHYEYLIYESAWDEYSAWMNASVSVEDPDGKTELRGLTPGGKRVVVVELDDRGEATGRKGSALFSADREGGEPVKVEVHRPFEVDGVVMARGEEDPVEGAKVFVVTEYPWQRSMGRQRARHHEGFKFDPVLTDSRGRFTLTGFTHGTFIIAAETEGAETRVTETINIERGVPVPSVTLRMESMARISGVITGCNDEPIEGVRLSTLGSPSVGGHEVRTDHEGRYEIAGLQEGRITIQIHPPNESATILEQFEISRGDDINHDIRVCSNITLTGTVYTNGQPGLSDNTSSIMLFHRDHNHQATHLNLDSRGRYSVNVSPGEWDIYLAAAQHSLYVPFDTVSIPDNEDDRSVEHDIHLQMASCDIVFEFPEDFPRSQGYIQFVPVDLPDLPRRGGMFVIQEGDDRRHLPGIPEGEYVVKYQSFNALLVGNSDPTPVIAGELNVVFVEVNIADGDRARVAEAQLLLRSSGFDAGPIDGLMGPMTAGAIRAFQEAKGLTVTGKVNEGLLEALRNN